MSNDADLARSAQQKISRGEKPSRAEQRALNKIREQSQLQFLRALPKKMYVEMSGRQHRTLDDQASRYDLPLRGETVDMFAVLRAFHNLLAENAHKLLADEDEAETGENSPALEKLRIESWRIKRMKRRELQNNLVRRDFVQEVFGMLAQVMRQGQEKLQRMENSEGSQVVNDMLKAIEKHHRRTFGKDE